jgi:hypothetical protein
MIDRLLRLLLTLPVSVHIEGEIAREYNYEDIIADFWNLKKRKVDF